MGKPLLVGKPYVGDYRHSACAEYHLHRDFIHAVGTGKHVASGIGDADGVEYALEDAILAVGSVEHRDYHIKMRYHRVAAQQRFLGSVEIIVAVGGTHVHLGALLQKFGQIAVVSHIEQGFASVPASLLGYIYRGNVIPVTVYGVHCL